MPRRAAGTLLPLELDLLTATLAADPSLCYGSALAAAVGGVRGDRLLGHGTLYKALDRLERFGLLESEWEDGDASALGRPLRRLYRCTGAGAARATAQDATGQRAAHRLATS